MDCVLCSLKMHSLFAIIVLVVNQVRVVGRHCNRKCSKRALCNSRIFIQLSGICATKIEVTSCFTRYLALICSVMSGRAPVPKRACRLREEWISETLWRVTNLCLAHHVHGYIHTSCYLPMNLYVEHLIGAPSCSSNCRLPRSLDIRMSTDETLTFLASPCAILRCHYQVWMHMLAISNQNMLL